MLDAPPQVTVSAEVQPVLGEDRPVSLPQGMAGVATRI